MNSRIRLVAITASALLCVAVWLFQFGNAHSEIIQTTSTAVGHKTATTTAETQIASLSTETAVGVMSQTASVLATQVANETGTTIASFATQISAATLARETTAIAGTEQASGTVAALTLTAQANATASLVSLTTVALSATLEADVTSTAIAITRSAPGLTLTKFAETKNAEALASAIPAATNTPIPTVTLKPFPTSLPTAIPTPNCIAEIPPEGIDGYRYPVRGFTDSTEEAESWVKKVYGIFNPYVIQDDTSWFVIQNVDGRYWWLPREFIEQYLPNGCSSPPVLTTLDVLRRQENLNDDDLAFASGLSDSPESWGLPNPSPSRWIYPTDGGLAVQPYRTTLITEMLPSGLQSVQGSTLNLSSAFSMYPGGLITYFGVVLADGTGQTLHVRFVRTEDNKDCVFVALMYDIEGKEQSKLSGSGDKTSSCSDIQVPIQVRIEINEDSLTAYRDHRSEQALKFSFPPSASPRQWSVESFQFSDTSIESNGSFFSWLYVMVWSHH